MELELRLPKFQGKLISIGHTIYYGRMINTGKIPITKLGGQIRVEYVTDEDDEEDDEEEEESVQLPNNRSNNRPIPSTNNGLHPPSSNTKTDPNNESKLSAFFAPMITGSGTLIAMMNASLHDKFMSRFISTTKLLGRNLMEITTTVPKQGYKLIKDFVLEKKKPPENTK